MMDINYELYKSVLSRRHHIEFLRGIQAAVYFTVCCQSVDQNTRTKTGSDAFYPKHKESPAHTRRRDSPAPH